MTISDVRRLTGPNLLLRGPGAVGEAEVPEGQEARTVMAWQQTMHDLLDRVGWKKEATAVRLYDGGASLAISAPLDGLYVATDMIEWSWQATLAQLNGTATPSPETAAERFKLAIAKDQDSALTALAGAAAEKGKLLLQGEDVVSCGLGVNIQAWPENALPSPDTIDWNAIGDVPVAMVSGTNGKSTTVRLTAAIGAAAGKTVGLCSSDWVKVAGKIVDEGDYSGPSGARQAVRDPRVELAVLGGCPRRHDAPRTCRAAG